MARDPKRACVWAVGLNALFGLIADSELRPMLDAAAVEGKAAADIVFIPLAF